MGKSLKGKELGQGISQRKDGMYQARFTNRFGKRQTIYAKTLSEIRKNLREEQYYDEKKLNVADSSITLDEWFDIWMETYKRNCRDSSRKEYASRYNRIRKELGWRKLSDLSSVVIQKAFNNLETDTSRKTTKIVLHDMLNRAVESEILDKNNASRVITVINHEEKREKRILDDKEVEILYKYTEQSVLGRILKVGLETGMRIGEILGLTWEDVDFDRNLIHVRKTLCHITQKGSSYFSFHPPKTKAGIRTIPMSANVKEALLQQRKITMENYSKFPPMAGFEDLTFPSNVNRPMTDDGIDKSLRLLIERINRDGIPFDIFSSHSLRHTFATNCIEKGMNPKVLQKILGHSTLQMTMDLYCHVREENVYREMASVMKMV